MPTEIIISDETSALAKAQAAAAGYSSIDDYIASMIGGQARSEVFERRARAIKRLKALRASLPKQSHEQILSDIAQSRADRL